ncbi:MAG: type II secretion system protein F [Nakamurella sp.]
MSAVLAAVALTLLLWPRPRAQVRALSLNGPSVVRRRRSTEDLVAAAAIGVPVAVLLVVGVSAGIAASMAAGMAFLLFRARRHEAEVADELAALLAALEVMIAELGVGAHPAHACRQAAQDAGGGPRSAVSETLSTMAGRSMLGGDVAGGIEQARVRDPQAWSRVAVAWRTAEQYGLPIAELLTSVRSDLLARSRFRDRTRAALAGAKATAMVLALLPVLGIGLGQAIGASPLSVLLGGGLGGILLVVGVGLVCAGLLWSRRIVGKVAGS